MLLTILFLFQVPALAALPYLFLLSSPCSGKLHDPHHVPQAHGAHGAHGPPPLPAYVPPVSPSPAPYAVTPTPMPYGHGHGHGHAPVTPAHPPYGYSPGPQPAYQTPSYSGLSAPTPLPVVKSAGAVAPQQHHNAPPA